MTEQTPIDDAVPTPLQSKATPPKPKLRKISELMARLPSDITEDSVNAGYLQQRERDGCASELALVCMRGGEAMNAEGPNGMPWSINGRVFVLRAEQWYLVPRYLVDNIRDHRNYAPQIEATRGSIRRISGVITANRKFTCEAITL